MPIHIPIYVNDKLIKTYHIGRFEGFADPDSINKYIIAQDKETWGDGVEFTHRYGDGIDKCISKGLDAINSRIEND
jgi:hypothetical protein